MRHGIMITLGYYGYMNAYTDKLKIIWVEDVGKTFEFLNNY